jgi:HK97 family phage portal protein
MMSHHNFLQINHGGGIMMVSLDERLRQWTQKVGKELEKKGFAATYLTTWTQPRITQEFALEDLTNEGYRKNAIASACIQMIATSAPEAPLKVYRMTDAGEVEATDHWFHGLIQRPTYTMSPYEVWEWVHTFLQTSGNAYIHLTRVDQNDPMSPIVEMNVLRPDFVFPMTNRLNQVVKYLYQINGEQREFMPHEMLHLKFPDPLNEAEGLSPLVRVFRELNIDNKATDFTATFFENAAVPFGLLSTEQRLREEETERFREKWMQWFKGKRGKNRFKPAVLGQGLDYKQIALDFQQMEFEQVRSMTETRICGAFGVDPVLLPSWVGIKYGGKYSNYSEARYHLWEETIIPLLRRIESKINSQLLVSEGVYCRFDLSQVQALQEDTNLLHARVRENFTSGILTLNEARKALGYDPDEEVGSRYTFQLKPTTPSAGVKASQYHNPKKQEKRSP